MGKDPSVCPEMLGPRSNLRGGERMGEGEEKGWGRGGEEKGWGRGGRGERMGEGEEKGWGRERRNQQPVMKHW